MAEKFSRRDILERLHKQVDSGKMILAFGAGIGLTAKCAELGEADLICVYSTAKYRMMGKPSLLAWMPYSNANETMFDMAREILPSVKKTPCIAGIGAHDPKLDMEILLNRSMEMGFSGITNEPFVGIYGREFGMQLEKAV